MPNPKSTSTKPKKGGKADKRLSENRSAAYQGGAKTKAHGAPTNPRQAGTKNRGGE